MFRLRFKKQSRPFPPHIVSRGGKSDRCEWKYATIFIHKKSKENNLTPEGIQKRQNKCIPTLTMVRKKLWHRATELQPHRMFTLMAHRPASAQFNKALFINPTFLLLFFYGCNYPVSRDFHTQVLPYFIGQDDPRPYVWIKLVNEAFHSRSWRCSKTSSPHEGSPQ